MESLEAMYEVLRAALGYRSDFYGTVKPFYVVARPGFFGGFGSWLDMFSPLNWNYPIYNSLAEIDGVSIYADWCQVGNDLAIAMEKHQPQIAA